jgi:hypothetical protein
MDNMDIVRQYLIPDLVNIVEEYNVCSLYEILLSQSMPKKYNHNMPDLIFLNKYADVDELKLWIEELKLLICDLESITRTK